MPRRYDAYKREAKPNGRVHAQSVVEIGIKSLDAMESPAIVAYGSLIANRWDGVLDANESSGLMPRLIGRRPQLNRWRLGDRERRQSSENAKRQRNVP